MSKIIRGAKGPPEPREPVRAEDTLNSKEFATVQDLLSEGEIEGFATPSKRGIPRNNANYNNACLADIFLNDTSVLNVSPTLSNSDFLTKLGNLQATDFSFQDVTFKPRFGENNQPAVGNVDNAVLTKQTNNIPPTHTNAVTQSGNPGPADSPNISANKDAVEVTVTFGALQKFETNGDILGTEVTLKIQRQIDNGSFVDRLTDTIKGRSADPYSKEYRIDLPDTYSQAKIRVVRVTADSNPDEIQDTFSVTRMEEISDDVRTYPDCAYSTLRLSSQQFSSVPQRAFRIRGIKVRIPAANGGLTPTVDLATGRINYPENYVFNGQMAAAQWCSCPAMILLDILTNKRYGLGDQIAPDQSTDAKLYENIDLFGYVAASRYANAIVTNEDGSEEARFSCNVSIQGSSEAFTLINELSGVMRAFPIWQTGTITLAQDKPTDPSYLFSLSNVGEGGFSYSGSSLRQRHSVVSVGYFNMDSREIDYEVEEDSVAIAKLGTVVKRVKAFACTSRGQAKRLAKAILFSEQQESETVTFTTSIDAGAIVRPGSVIQINDPVRSVSRRSGRIKSATTTAITVDNDQDLAGFAGINKKCSVILPDGDVEEIACTVTGSVITLTTALSAVPNVNAIWMLSSEPSSPGQAGAVKPQTFRVISIEEQDDVNYTITALTYIAGKYDNIEQGISLPPRNISLLNSLKAPPSGLAAVERIVVINNLAVSKIIASWEVRTGVSQYLVQHRFNNANWISEVVFRPDIEILNSQEGTYEIKVFSFNAALQLSAESSFITFNAQGKTAKPSAVQNLSYEPLDNKSIRLRWDLSTDPDVIHGGRVFLRHSTKTDGSGTFQNSVDLIPAIAGNSTLADVPALEGEYILKFQDDGGRFSENATSVIIDLPDQIDSKRILQDREDTDPTAFGGTKTNTTVVGGGLQLTNPATNLTGTYDFAVTMDLGAVYSVNLKRLIEAIGFTVGAANTIDNLIPPGTFWDDYATNGNFDGPAIDDVSASLSVNVTQDDPSSGSPSYAGFQTFANGTYKGRGFKFRCTLKSESIAHNISVQELGVTAAFEARTERSYIDSSNVVRTTPITSSTSSSGTTVTFANPFFTGTSDLGGVNAFPPSIGITIENASSGDYFVLSAITGTSFNIKIKNDSQNPVFIAKQFTFQAVGYGKGV